MINIRLADCITVTPGINQSREANREQYTFYDHSSFKDDYNQDNEEKNKGYKFYPKISLEEGDIVINNTLNMMAIVGKKNVGKVLTINFSKVEILNNSLDKNYLLYLFNDYNEVQREKERIKTVGSSGKIPVSKLLDIKIPRLEREKQEKIGNIYEKSLKLQKKIKKYATLVDKATNIVLKESIMEEENGRL